jgi:hypothetical protein
MSRGDEGTLRRLLHHSRKLHARTRENRARSGVVVERLRLLRGRVPRE